MKLLQTIEISHFVLHCQFVASFNKFVMLLLGSILQQRQNHAHFRPPVNSFENESAKNQETRCHFREQSCGIQTARKIQLRITYLRIVSISV